MTDETLLIEIYEWEQLKNVEFCRDNVSSGSACEINIYVSVNFIMFQSSWMYRI